MTKQEILNQVETILPKLQHYIEYKEVAMEPEQVTTVKNIADAILPGKIINWSCPACAGEVLTTIWSYYQREKI